MEEKTLNPQESMEIITEMICRSKTTRYIGDGNLLLLWGYVTIAVAALVWILLAITHSPAVNWLWYLIWIIGGIATPVIARRNRHRQGVTTYADTICNSVWAIVGMSGIILTAFCLALMLFGGKDAWSAFFILPLLIVGIAETVQGTVMRERSLRYGGIIGIIVGLFTVCCIAGDLELRAAWFMPMFIVSFAAMMIWPGHVLNYKSRKER